MTERAGSFFTGGWWKFSKYEIRAQRICPAEEAVLEWYDPWQQYQLSNLQNGYQPPYQKLIALLVSCGAEFSESEQRLMLEYSDTRAPIPEDVGESILKWCSEFGLLGIFHQTVLSYDWASRWVLGWEGSCYCEINYVRNGGSWDQVKTWRGVPRTDGKPTFPPRDAPLGKSSPIRRRVLVCEDGDRFTTRSSGWIARDFFGHTGPDPNFEIPAPNTPEFWAGYSERLADFLRWAVGFYSALDPFLTYPSRGIRSAAGIEKLLRPMCISLSLDENGTLREGWSSPSLICSFARMAYQDLTRGSILRPCECCGQPFRTDNRRSQYCSDACGWKHRKRRAKSRGRVQQERGNG